MCNLLKHLTYKNLLCENCLNNILRTIIIRKHLFLNNFRSTYCLPVYLTDNHIKLYQKNDKMISLIAPPCNVKSIITLINDPIKYSEFN